MKRKVLLISGRPPIHSAGYVNDTIHLLEKADCNVDFLTLYNFEGQKDNQYNVFAKPIKQRLVEYLNKYPWLRLFRFIYHLPYIFLSKLISKQKSLMHGNYLLVFEKEENPPIQPEKLFEKIHDVYDYFVIIIVQDMVTSKTIKMLYEKYHKPVILMSPDMYHFTGNCFFPNDCNNYLNECCNCPAYKEMNLEDSAHNNFIYKKSVYENIRCAFRCNTQVYNIVLQSHIIPEEKLFRSMFILDSDVFKPYDRQVTKNKFNIPDNKSFIIMVRYIGLKNIDWNRKGGFYLLETLEKLYKITTVEERSKSLLMFVGTNEVESELNIKFDTICTGNLSRNDLILAYNAASVFFCPSINDSGPSMVNQSMACSTPVVAFNQGTAIDVIENGKTGYKAELYDTDTLSEALLTILRMDKGEYELLRENARNKAVECNSIAAGVKQFERVFESFESGIL